MPPNSVKVDPKEVLKHSWRWKEIPGASALLWAKFVHVVAMTHGPTGAVASVVSGHSVGFVVGAGNGNVTRFFRQIGLPPSAEDLKDLQDAAMSDAKFKSGPGVTHCSEATAQIARAFGVNTASFGPPGEGFYLANEQVANLARAAGSNDSGWQKIGLKEAQNYADDGKLVVIGWINPRKGGHGHTVTVRPDPKNPHRENPTVAQVGDTNKVMPFRYAFGKDKRDSVQVYVYTGN